jgi:hypothetical protein
MTNEIKKAPPKLDGLDGYQDEVEGREQQARGIIQGALLKFTNDYTWVTRDGEELSPDLELVVVDIARVVQKWCDGQPVETMILEPLQKFPDVERMNEQTPRNEWVKGPDGKSRGPWQAQHIVYLFDPKTMSRYTWPTGTVGGAICCRDVSDATKWVRKYRGTQVYPLVALSDTFFPTSFGGRQRPHFIVKNWIGFGGDGKVLPAPAEPKPPTAPSDTASEKPLQSDAGVHTVEPSSSEEMDDSIPSDGGASKSDRNPGSRAPAAAKRTVKKPAPEPARKRA